MKESKAADQTMTSIAMKESKAADQTAGYMTSIARHFPSGLSNFHTHHNAKCVVCEALSLKMVRVGAVIFCKPCVEVVFESDDPVRKEREIYLKWLHKSQKYDEG